MSDGKSSRELLDKLKRMVEQMERDRATQTTRFKVNKQAHRVRFENETENSVAVVIEPQIQEGSKK